MSRNACVRKVRTHLRKQRTVVGNSHLEQSKRCEQRRQCRKARAPSGVVTWKHVVETAKSLPVCKTVPDIILMRGESLESCGNI